MRLMTSNYGITALSASPLTLPSGGISKSLRWNMCWNGGMENGIDYGNLHTAEGTISHCVSSFFHLFPLRNVYCS